MTGRARSATRTRADILEAARAQFAQHGYDRTTTRSVAAAVGVDAALVNRYFGSKADLFAEAARLEINFPDLTGMTPPEIARALVDCFFDLYDGDGGLLALVRAATSNAEAAERLLAVLLEKAAPALEPVAVDHPGERTALVGSQFVGFAFARYVLRVPSIVRMSRDDVVTWLGPVFVHYLTDPDPGRALTAP